MHVRLGALLLLLVLACPPAVAHEPPEEALVAELPFLGEKTNRIYVDLAPPENSRRLRILLDTGASDSVFSPLAAREAGVRVKRTKQRPYQRKTVLGRDLYFWVDTRSSDTGTRMGWEYGLLGCGFLEEYVVELDFDRRRVRFFDPDRYAVPESVEGEDETVVPMRLTGKRPIFEVRVEGQPVKFLVDTGSPFSLTVDGRIAEKAGIVPDLGEVPAEMIAGPVAQKLGEAARVEIGSLVLEGVPLLVAPRGHYNWAGPDDSILGYDVLQEFTVRFDWEHGRAWLKRRKEVTRTLLGEDWQRIRDERRGVAPGEPADVAP